MIKKLFKLAICGALVGTLCTSFAFAADPVAVTKDGDTVTVEVSTLDAGEETTLLAVPEGVSVSDAFANTANIYHMDQTAASDDGVATFVFKYTGTSNMDIYSGYATMAATDVPYEGVLDLSNQGGGDIGGGDEPVDPEEPEDPEDPVTPTFMYGDVNNDATINLFDVTAIIDRILHSTAFKDSATQAAYANGDLAADVNADNTINLFDVTAVIDKILHETPFGAEQQ